MGLNGSGKPVRFASLGTSDSVTLTKFQGISVYNNAASGSVTLTNSLGETYTLAAGETVNIGQPDTELIDSLTIATDGSATAKIIYYA